MTAPPNTGTSLFTAALFALPCLALVVLLSGCASTVLYDRSTGKPIARFQGDMAGSSYRDLSTSWTVERVSHSTATRAGGSLIGTTGAAVSGVVVSAATRGIVR